MWCTTSMHHQYSTTIVHHNYSVVHRVQTGARPLCTQKMDVVLLGSLTARG